VWSIYVESKRLFPLLPQEIETDPLVDYFQNIKIGVLFAYSDYEEFCPKQTVIESVILKENRINFSFV